MFKLCYTMQAGSISCCEFGREEERTIFWLKIVKFIYYIRKKCSKNHFWMAEWLRVDHLFKRLRFKSGNIHFFYLSHLIVLFSEHFSKNPNSTQYTKLNTCTFQDPKSTLRMRSWAKSDKNGQKKWRKVGLTQFDIW